MSRALQLLIYSETTAATVSGNLGRAEYSYYFILEKYLPLLCRLGEVVYVSDPHREVDPLYRKALKRGRESVFLSFSPPHRTEKRLRCPTVCVLAWEFDTIPDESWDPEEPWNNWVEALRRIGNVITISEYATRVIRQRVGPGPRIVTIPAPVVRDLTSPELDEIERHRPSGGRNPLPGRMRQLELVATVIDSLELDITADTVTPRASDGIGAEQLASWEGEPVERHFTSRDMSTDVYLVGFYSEEEWGCWSRTSHPSIVLPWSVSGKLRLTLGLVGFGENQGRELDVTLGDQSVRVVLPPSLEMYDFDFTLDQPANTIHLSGITPIAIPGMRDHRTLGVGISRLSLSRPGRVMHTGEAAAPTSSEGAAAASVHLAFAGPVYTSIFNPEDGRKNWHDIVTAFCWAFRDDPDKTLVLKMSHRNRSVFLGDLFLLFSRLWPFRCRVVAIHGYLTADELRDLVAVTDYFVNASLAEGQCLPLLEFMADGVPAIAPDHTAMQTYVNRDNAFVVYSSPQPYIWPQDPRRAYRTRANRISWDSLRQAYVDSAAALTAEDGAYTAMSRTAAAEVRSHYSECSIAQKLEGFLWKTARRRRWWHRIRV